MKTKDAQKWANALRSGKHKQGKLALEKEDGTLCCLGVACKIFIPKPLQEISDGRLVGGYPDRQKYAPKWLMDLNNDTIDKLGISLSLLNDNKEYSFDEIADLIELIYVHKAL